MGELALPWKYCKVLCIRSYSKTLGRRIIISALSSQPVNIILIIYQIYYFIFIQQLKHSVVVHRSVAGDAGVYVHTSGQHFEV